MSDYKKPPLYHRDIHRDHRAFSGKVLLWGLETETPHHKRALIQGS
jgi:hypothetical protein